MARAAEEPGPEKQKRKRERERERERQILLNSNWMMDSGLEMEPQLQSDLHERFTKESSV